MTAAALYPPKAAPTLIARLKARYFRSWFDGTITVAIIALAAWAVPAIVDWAILRATLFTPDGQVCARGGGACWAVITNRYFYIFLGTYPIDQAWRPATVTVMLIALAALSCFRFMWNGRLPILWIGAAFLTWLLMRGGVFGLPQVETSRWGGLPITLIIAVFSLMAALPLGILLALGRRSRLPSLRILCTIYIELMRGVPLVSVLFMASVMLPLFLPDGFTIDRLMRAMVAFTGFSAAYVAEVVRGGLNAVPKGQYEAAASMALSTVQSYQMIILPQALRVSIPALVNTFIEFFKDTSLILIVGMLDLFSAGRSVLSDPAWLPFAAEVYLFLGAVYFLFCFSMSKASQRMEGAGR